MCLDKYTATRSSIFLGLIILAFAGICMVELNEGGAQPSVEGSKISDLLGPSSASVLMSPYDIQGRGYLDQRKMDLIENNLPGEPERRSAILNVLRSIEHYHTANASLVRYMDPESHVAGTEDFARDPDPSDDDFEELNEQEERSMQEVVSNVSRTATLYSSSAFTRYADLNLCAAEGAWLDCQLLMVMCLLDVALH